MVPMAPSRTTMRRAKSSRNDRTRSAEVLMTSGTGHLAFGARAHAERVTDGVGELRAVQRVEMKLIDAVSLQRVHLFDGHGGRNQLARLGIVLESIEAMLQPLGNGRAAARREPGDLRETGDRQDARHDRCVDAARRAAIAEAQ